jgi:hypothetical protein
MSEFSFTCRDGDDVIVEPHAAGVGSEAEAIDCGRLLAQTHQAVEVWSGERLVLRFQNGKVAV